MASLIFLFRRTFTMTLILVGDLVGGLINRTVDGALEVRNQPAASVLASLSFVFLLAASAMFLGETVGANRWIGALLIVAGMFLVGRK